MSKTNSSRYSGSRARNQSASSNRNRTAASRGSQSAKTKSTGKARKNTKRRRKPTPDYRKIAIIGTILILVITGIVFGAKFSKGTGEKENETSNIEAEETELQKDVVVDGITITGMSREEAKSKILEHYKWGMKVTYEDAEPYEISNLMEGKVDTLLDEIFKGEPKSSYTLDTKGLDDTIEAEVAAIANKWDIPAKNGGISGFDKQTNKFIYSGEQTGKIINQKKLSEQIKLAVAAKDFQASLVATATIVQPEITEAQAKDMYRVIGTKSTNTTSNKDRNTNIKIAADAINGLIIQPGEEFSFNKTTGNRTLERGYKPAGAYVNGVLVEEPGGGVCQVSSTLYNAVVFAGLKTTERHAHSYEPSYITPGEDAMVSYDGYAGPDMRFINNSKDSVAIRATFADQKLSISIVGIPILKDGEKWYMKSQKTEVLDPPAPTYEENQELEPGVEKIVKNATNGSRWLTNLVKEENGVIVSDELLHKSTYKGKAATIQRNTSGVVIVPTSESTSAAETTVPQQSEAVPPTSESQQPGTTEPTSGTSPQGPGTGPGIPTEPAPTAATTPAPVQEPGGASETEIGPGQIAPPPF